MDIMKYLVRYIFALARTGFFAIGAAVFSNTVSDCVSDVGGVTMGWFRRGIMAIKGFFTGFLGAGQQVTA